jgi:alkaline phosphatase
MLFLALAASALIAAAGPTNVILMIGDGMGPDEVWAAGAYRWGTDYHKFGGQRQMAMETLPTHYFVTTYPVSGSYDPTWAGGDPEYPWKRATDSAAAGTAMASGQKTFYGAVNYVARKVPDSKGRLVEVKEPVTMIQQYAQAAGMKTGAVTSMTFCNATPATFIGHATSRADYTAIMSDAIQKTKPDVIMGAGNPSMAPESIPGRPDLKPEQVKYLYVGKADWASLQEGTAGYTLVQSRAAFQQLSVAPPAGRVLGAFQKHDILTARNADGKSADPDLPTLAEMAKGALAVLDNPRGFFVMIEGGAIDERGHVCDLDGNIGETLGFDEAVQTVLDWIGEHGGWENNLLIVTADHETGYLHDVKPIGPGKLPAATWGTDGTLAGHTNRLVDLWTCGAGSAAFAGYARDVDDFERGTVKIVDNTDIFKVMKAALPR